MVGVYESGRGSKFVKRVGGHRTLYGVIKSGRWSKYEENSREVKKW